VELVKPKTGSPEVTSQWNIVQGSKAL